MRACFLGHNICALGYGVATLQAPPVNEAAEKKDPPGERPPYPIVMPTDGHEYGRPPFYPLAHPLRLL